MNIFHNFSTSKIILCGDRDPPWMNEKIKHLITKKKNYISYITLELSNAKTFSKAKHHERLAIKLNDPKAAPKTYWSILKHLLMVRRFHLF